MSELPKSRFLAVALTCGALVLGGVAAAAGGSEPLVLFQSQTPSGGFRTMVMRADGSDVRALRAPFGTGLGIEWSPDGSMIAYARSSFEPLYIVDRRTGRRTRAASKAGTFSWSPRGTYFVYGDFPFRIRDRSGRVRSFTAGGFEGWTPDERFMLLDHGEMSVVDPATGRAKALPDVSTEFGWSPDGRRVAYSSEQTRTLCIANRDGGARRCLKHPKGVAYSIAWSHDGGHVVFVNHVDSGPRIRVLDVVTMQTTVLRGAASGPDMFVDDVSWSPDDRMLVFSVETPAGGNGAGDIWIVSSGGKPVARRASPADESEPRWIPASWVAGLVGSRVAPVGPDERFVSSNEIEVNGKVTDLAADGTRLAFLTRDTPDGCDHAVVWDSRLRTLRRVDRAANCRNEALSDVALAGSLAAWIDETGGINREVTIATSEPSVAVGPDRAVHGPPDGGGSFVGNLVGDGSLLAWNEWSSDTYAAATIHDEFLKQRAGAGDRVLLTGISGFRAVDADRGRVLVLHRDGSVALVKADGSIVDLAGVTGRRARLDGRLAAVSTGASLQTFDASSGKLEARFPLAAATELDDLHGGIAVFTSGGRILLIDVLSGKRAGMSLPGPVTDATLEPGGLFAAYRVGKRFRIRHVGLATVRALLK